LDPVPGKFDSIVPEELALPPVETDAKAEAHVDQICSFLQKQGVKINPMVADYFKDPSLYNSLPQEIRESENRFAEIIAHSMAFNDFVYKARKKVWSGDKSGFLGEEVSIPETTHHDGRTRRAETGEKLNLTALVEENINPDMVLFFRVTQSSDQPKPEYYWTSDYYETKRGLNAEIPREQREKAVILVAPLSAVDENKGLIADINDDEGLAVRQIGQGPFDTSKCISKFKAESEETF